MRTILGKSLFLIIHFYLRRLILSRLILGKMRACTHTHIYTCTRSCVKFVLEWIFINYFRFDKQANRLTRLSSVSGYRTGNWISSFQCEKRGRKFWSRNLPETHFPSEINPIILIVADAWRKENSLFAWNRSVSHIRHTHRFYPINLVSWWKRFIFNDWR